MFSRKWRAIAAALVASATAGASYAGWTAATDTTNNGNWTFDGAAAGCTSTPNDFNGIATSAYNQTVAYEFGFPWLCGQFSDFSARAEAGGTMWTKRWNWTGCPIPNHESTMDITVKMLWALDGNCNNFALTKAYAKTFAHSQVVINSAPDNAGDYTGEGQWSGEKREGDTWSGGLSLDWDSDGPGAGVSLSWSSDPTDEWQSGPTTETKRYLQNIKNKVDGDYYEYVQVQVGLLSEAEAAADTNAYHAVARTECWIHSFSLSQPG